jgi:hypothetical protein
VKILEGEFAEGDTVIVDFDAQASGVVFRRPGGETVTLPQEVSTPGDRPAQR